MLETILFVVSVTLVIVSVRLYEATTEIKRLNKRRDATVADILDQKGRCRVSVVKPDGGKTFIS